MQDDIVCIYVCAVSSISNAKIDETAGNIVEISQLCEKSEFELTYSRSKLASLVSIFKGSVTASL